MLIEEIRSIKSTRRDLRNFGLVVGAGFALIGGFLLWKSNAAGPWFIGAGALLALSGLAIPTLLKPLQKVWMTLAVIMGWFMTRVILSVLFYTTITPIGLAARIFGKRFMDHHLSRDSASYWHKREGTPSDLKHFERQF